METSPQGTCGRIGEDMSIILITAAQLIFFTSFHRYISWPITGPDGSVTRLSLLTDSYFTWLPFPIVASIVVVVASIVMLFWHNDWFRQAAWIGFCLLGVAVTVSLLTIFPFDFSVIPDGTAAVVVPTAVTLLFVLMAVFYGTTALVLSVKLIRSYTAKQETG